jgi:predicted RNA-binding protein associated with RNAse of E/G family
MTNFSGKPFTPGQTVVVRELWQEKIWTARPEIVVQDNSELIALYIPASIHCKHHYGLHGDHNTAIERKNNEWALQDNIQKSSYHYIKLAIPGESYSVLVFWNSRDNSLRYWYVNLEDPENPMRRTRIGFDLCDQILDVIIEPSLRDWRWDDEDELQEAIDAGLISSEQAKALYAKGEEIRNLIMSGESIFNGWEKWKPDPSWQVPVLPDGWDII